MTGWMLLQEEEELEKTAAELARLTSSKQLPLPIILVPDTAATPSTQNDLQALKQEVDDANFNALTYPSDCDDDDDMYTGLGAVQQASSDGLFHNGEHVDSDISPVVQRAQQRSKKV